MKDLVLGGSVEFSLITEFTVEEYDALRQMAVNPSDLELTGVSKDLFFSYLLFLGYLTPS